jgi:hypothetical protein
MSSNQINQLEALVKKQGEQIERLHDTIYHLLADIYPLQEEGNYIKIYSVYNHMKYDKFCNTRWLLDEDDDGSDEYLAFFKHRSSEASRIAKELDTGDSSDEEEEEEEEEESLTSSTHSSMPSLVSVSSADEEELNYYKLPPSSDENSNTSSSSSDSKRMRYSAELCGNN